MPWITLPNTACFPSSQAVAASVTKNQLGSAGIRPGVCHRKNTLRVVRQLRVELIENRVARPASSVSLGTARLEHEAFDYAVEDHSVVIALLNQVDEVLRRNGGTAFEELDLESCRGWS